MVLDDLVLGAQGTDGDRGTKRAEDCGNILHMTIYFSLLLLPLFRRLCLKAKMQVILCIWKSVKVKYV